MKIKKIAIRARWPSHGDAMVWKRSPHYWPFVKESTDRRWFTMEKGHWCGPLMFSLMLAWLSCWTLNRATTGDLILMFLTMSVHWRHNERDDVSNHRRLDYLLDRLLRRRLKKHQIFASLAFVRGIHSSPMDSPHKGPVMWKMFPSTHILYYIGIDRRIYQLAILSRCISSCPVINAYMGHIWHSGQPFSLPCNVTYAGATSIKNIIADNKTFSTSLW